MSVSYEISDELKEQLFDNISESEFKSLLEQRLVEEAPTASFVSADTINELGTSKNQSKSIAIELIQQVGIAVFSGVLVEVIKNQLNGVKLKPKKKIVTVKIDGTEKSVEQIVIEEEV